MKFIGISGNAGTGKDFITRYLLVPMLTNGLPYVIASFADHFKLDAIVTEHLDRDKVYGRKDKHTRTRLQLKGTEEGRNVHGPDIWVNILDERIRQYEIRGIKYVFITDCRFVNEIEYVKSKGGVVIKVIAPERHLVAMREEGGNALHTSETSMNEYTNWDFIINNDFSDISNVAKQVWEVCEEIKERLKYICTLFVYFNDINDDGKCVHETIDRIAPDNVVIFVKESKDIVKLYEYGLSKYSTDTNTVDKYEKYTSQFYYSLPIRKCLE